MYYESRRLTALSHYQGGCRGSGMVANLESRNITVLTTQARPTVASSRAALG